MLVHNHGLSRECARCIVTKNPPRLTIGDAECEIDERWRVFPSENIIGNFTGLPREIYIPNMGYPIGKTNAA